MYFAYLKNKNVMVYDYVCNYITKVTNADNIALGVDFIA